MFRIDVLPLNFGSRMSFQFSILRPTRSDGCERVGVVDGGNDGEPLGPAAGELGRARAFDEAHRVGAVPWAMTLSGFSLRW